MSKMESLLHMLADYRKFCGTTKSDSLGLDGFDGELSENELETVAAARNMTPPPLKRKKEDR